MIFKSITTNDSSFNKAMTLYHQTFPEDIREPERVFERSIALKEVDESKYHFIIAEKGEQFAGFIAFHLEVAEHIGYCVYLVVDPDFRGQHISRELMHEAERIMKSYDPELQYIILECEKDDDGKSPLEPFYAKFGYQPLTMNYVQPGLHGGEAVPMNLFLKVINDHHTSDVSHAIQYIYKVKYHHANLIDEKLLNQYIDAF